MKDPTTIKFDTLTAALVLLREAGGEDQTARILDAVRTVRRLEALEKRLRVVAVAECNGYYGPERLRGAPPAWGDAEQADADARTAKLAAKAEAVAHPYGVKLKIGGDPRGSQLRLMTPLSGRYNTWGGAESGWAL